MKNVLIVLAVVAAVALAAGSIRLENPEYCGNSTDDLLAYDDGTPHWIWYSTGGAGYWWGVWFDTDNFVAGSTGLECNFTEWWFYHHGDVPWGIDEFYAELWNADEYFGSSAILDQSDITAIHYVATFCNYATAITTEQNFWLVCNNERTTNGSPTPRSDNTDNFTGNYHSYASSDGFLWDPMENAGHAVDFLFRADGTVISGALDSESWGAIKGLYR